MESHFESTNWLRNLQKSKDQYPPIPAIAVLQKDLLSWQQRKGLSGLLDQVFASQERLKSDFPLNLFAKVEALNNLANFKTNPQYSMSKRMSSVLQENRSLEDMFRGIAVAQATAGLNASISKSFRALDAVNHWKDFGGFHQTAAAVSAIAKSSRIITRHLDSFQNYYQIEYDLLNVAEPAEEKLQVVTPEIFILETKRIRQIIQEIYRNNLSVYKVTDRQFEELIAELLDRKGFAVELTKQTRDGGYDIIALSTDHAGTPLKYLVECKKHRNNRPVGIQVVRSLSDVVRENGANKGMIFTTSYFSRDVRNRQKKSPYLLDLKDYNDIIGWVNEYITSFI